MTETERLDVAIAAFFTANADFAQFDTDATWIAIDRYVAENWPNNANARFLPASYEIAFKALKSELKPIRGWQPPVAAEFREHVRTLPAHEARELYRRDPEFRQQWDQLALEKR